MLRWRVISEAAAIYRHLDSKHLKSRQTINVMK